MIGQSSYPLEVDTPANLVEVEDNYLRTLTASIDADDDTMTVTSTSGAPNTGILTLSPDPNDDDPSGPVEKIAYTGKTGTQFTGLIRGYGGTVAQSWPADTSVEITIVREMFRSHAEAIIAIEQRLTAGDIDANKVYAGPNGAAGAPAFRLLVAADIPALNYSPVGHNHDASYSPLGHTHAFASITATPTTLAGYGITDAYPLTGNPSNFATVAYVDSVVVGLLDDRGNYDASTNLFPSSGGSGTAGAILKGDLWTISVAGTLGGVAVTPGDLVRALVDSPGQTAANWAISEANIGYAPLNAAMASGSIYIGSAGGIGTAQILSGDVTVSNLGVTAIGAGKVTDAMLAGSISISKLSITGTPDGTKFLRDDGSWQTVSGGGGTPGGLDTQVQFNDGGSFGGNAGLVFNKAGGILTVGETLSVATGWAVSTKAILHLGKFIDGSAPAALIWSVNGLPSNDWIWQVPSGYVSYGSMTFNCGAAFDSAGRNFFQVGIGGTSRLYLADASGMTLNGYPATITRNSIGSTSTDGLVLQNTTAAAVGVQQWSPRLRFTGQGWKTGSSPASQTVDWIIENIPIEGADFSPYGELRFSYQINGGGYLTGLRIQPEWPHYPYVGSHLWFTGEMLLDITYGYRDVLTIRRPAGVMFNMGSNINLGTPEYIQYTGGILKFSHAPTNMFQAQIYTENASPLYDEVGKGRLFFAVGDPTYTGIVHTMMLDEDGSLAIGFAFNSTTTLSPARLAVNARNASKIGLIIRGAAAQAANLAEWQDSTLAVLASVGPQGYFTFPGSLRLLGRTTVAGVPTTTELPTDKDWSIHKNSTSGVVSLAYNDGGTIKKIDLT